MGSGGAGGRACFLQSYHDSLNPPSAQHLQVYDFSPAFAVLLTACSVLSTHPSLGYQLCVVLSLDVLPLASVRTHWSL
jgi:hypothetical protein